MLDTFELAKEHLSKGSLHAFRDQLDPALPRVAAGCYTVWDDAGRFVYAGMAGRTLTVEAIEVSGKTQLARVTGIRDRLAAHRNGRRSGDQFAVYVFDRFVLAPSQRSNWGKPWLVGESWMMTYALSSASICTTGGGRHETALKLWPWSSRSSRSAWRVLCPSLIPVKSRTDYRHQHENAVPDRDDRDRHCRHLGSSNRER